MNGTNPILKKQENLKEEINTIKTKWIRKSNHVKNRHTDFLATLLNVPKDSTINMPSFKT